MLSSWSSLLRTCSFLSIILSKLLALHRAMCCNAIAPACAGNDLNESYSTKIASAQSTGYHVHVGDAVLSENWPAAASTSSPVVANTHSLAHTGDGTRSTLWILSGCLFPWQEEANNPLHLQHTPSHAELLSENMNKLPYVTGFVRSKLRTKIGWSMEQSNRAVERLPDAEYH